MRDQLLEAERCAKVFGVEMTSLSSKTKWVVAVWRHIQLEGWQRVNHIRQEASTRYVLSEVIQLPALLTMWGIYLSIYV